MGWRYTLQDSEQRSGLIWLVYLVFCLHWLFVAGCRLLLLGSPGSRVHGLSAYSVCVSLVVAYGLSCPMTCGILVLWPGVEPMSPALEGTFLATGPPGQSLFFFFQVLLLFQCKDFIFWSSFRFTVKLRGRYRNFFYLLSPHMQASPIFILHPPVECNIGYNQWAYSDMPLSPRAHSLHYGSLILWHILWVW